MPHMGRLFRSLGCRYSELPYISSVNGPIYNPGYGSVNDDIAHKIFGGIENLTADHGFTEKNLKHLWRTRWRMKI